MQPVHKALRVPRVLKGPRDDAEILGPLARWVRRDLQARRARSARWATPVRLAALDRKVPRGSRALPEVVVIREIGDRQDSEGPTGHLAREARLVRPVTRVDLDSPDLRDLEEKSACQELREHLDRPVSTDTFFWSGWTWSVEEVIMFWWQSRS